MTVVKFYLLYISKPTNLDQKVTENLYSNKAHGHDIISIPMLQASFKSIIRHFIISMSSEMLFSRQMKESKCCSIEKM